MLIANFAFCNDFYLDNLKLNIGYHKCYFSITKNTKSLYMSFQA